MPDARHHAMHGSPCSASRFIIPSPHPYVTSTNSENLVTVGPVHSDRDVQEFETETRRLQISRRDRDVEMHVVGSKQVNVSNYHYACPLVSRCILNFCVFNSSDYVQTGFMPLQPIGDYWPKTGLGHGCGALRCRAVRCRTAPHRTATQCTASGVNEPLLSF